MLARLGLPELGGSSEWVATFSAPKSSASPLPAAPQHNGRTTGPADDGCTRAEGGTADEPRLEPPSLRAGLRRSIVGPYPRLDESIHRLDDLVHL